MFEQERWEIWLGVFSPHLGHRFVIIEEVFVALDSMSCRMKGTYIRMDRKFVAADSRRLRRHGVILTSSRLGEDLMWWLSLPILLFVWQVLFDVFLDGIFLDFFLVNFSCCFILFI